ncbi:hypothetical protein BLNAU_1271 [Blattamonas nauphoetae]|uniref:Uncharacterized protein n=1 Tax=Blattamonas nauphoetae TaxID=2049346 RepID=A0ABQ9YIX6_9EUKA|nr:hypothetical protein BLNAU_1271 [Blattamonas nauphoetae]
MKQFYTVRLDPFVISISHYNDLLLIARTYSNMTLMSEESVFRQQNQLLPDSVAASSLILKSQFSFVSDGIDGTIVRLFCHTASFLAHNTTFSNSLFEEKTFESPQTLSDLSNNFIKCVFSDCSSSSNGGSLSASYTVLTSSFDLILRDNQFSSSKSDRNGGAVAVILDGSTNEECRLTVDIEHCIFSNTAARTGEGGGVFINVQGDSKCCGSIAIRAKSEFNDSSSTIGGCICSSRSTTQCHSLMLDDSFVESSHAEMDGTIAHEVSLSSTSSFTATSFLSYNCSSSLGGSFVFVIHKYLSISVTSSTFTRSTSTACGGCIAINQNNSASNFHCVMVLSDLDIRNCSAQLRGGFFHLDQGQNDFEGEYVISCDNTNATSCSSRDYGGFFSIHQAGSVNPKMSSSTITSLSSGGFGAFIYCPASYQQVFAVALTIALSHWSISKDVQFLWSATLS